MEKQEYLYKGERYIILKETVENIMGCKYHYYIVKNSENNTTSKVYQTEFDFIAIAL